MVLPSDCAEVAHYAPFSIQARTDAGEDAWEQEQRGRSKNQQGRDSSFDKDMRRWEPFMELLQRADACDTYSLFFIQGIRPLRKQEITLASVPAMASELRDMFMVYCDGMDIALRNLGDDSRTTPLVDGAAKEHPPAKFKYSELRINVVAHRATDRGGFITPHRISLRDDAPLVDLNAAGIDWDEFSRKHRQGGWDCGRLPTMAEVEQMHAASSQDGRGVGALEYLQELQISLQRSPTRLLELCAPEPFHFRLKHSKLGCITGFAVYMPVAEGRETKDELKLHRNSVAFCFWKGRQMPYACLNSLLPFMSKLTTGAGSDGSSAADRKKLKDRVRLMLFFGSVAEVDDCKFKFNDDIEEQLHPSKRRAGSAPVEDPYTDFQQWKPEAKKWTRSNISSSPRAFENWLSHSTEKYDRTCTMFEKIEGDALKRLETKTTRKVGAGKLAFGRVKWGASRSMMDIKQQEHVLFTPTNLKIESSFSGAKKTLKLVGTALYFEVDASALNASPAGYFAATCEVIVRREPAELYGQLYAIRCSLLQSIAPAETKNVLASERKKAPSEVSAEFITSPDADGAPSKAITTGSTKEQPYEVPAGEALPIVAVHSRNSEGKEVVNWLRPTGTGGTYAHLQVQQSILHTASGEVVDGYDDTDHTTGSSSIVGTDQKAFRFNYGKHVELKIPRTGDYELRYTLLPIRGAEYPFLNATGAGVVTPTASLFVRVHPGKISRMNLQLMEKTMTDPTTFVPADELFLGRRYAIDATFYDQNDNPCTVDKADLTKSLSKQMVTIEKMVIQGKPSPPHLIYVKDISLAYNPKPPAEGEMQGEQGSDAEYPVQVKCLLRNGRASKKEPVEMVRLHWGLTDNQKYFRLLSPVTPTPQAIAQQKFSRSKPKAVKAAVSILLPDLSDASGFRVSPSPNH